MSSASAELAKIDRVDAIEIMAIIGLTPGVVTVIAGVCCNVSVLTALTHKLKGDAYIVRFIDRAARGEGSYYLITVLAHRIGCIFDHKARLSVLYRVRIGNKNNIAFGAGVGPYRVMHLIFVKVR